MSAGLRARIFFTILLLLGVQGLHAQLNAAFTWSPLDGCAPQAIQFTSTSTGSISAYSWNFGNSTAPSALQNPASTYINPGTYTVTLTITGASGSKSVSHTITIYPPPTISFSFSPSSGCAPLNVSFVPSVTPGVSGPVTYVWDFGDGFTSGSQTTSHSYNTGGVYPPKLTVTNSKGCATTLISSNSVTVYALPVISFSAYPTKNCSLPAAVGFSGSITGNGPFSSSWDFGDGGSSSQANPNHTYNGAGTFSVKLTVTDVNGCTDSLKIPNYISTRASIGNFSGPSAVCAARLYGSGSSTYLYPLATFTNTTPSTNISATYWNWGDGHTDTGLVSSHGYTTPGTYTIKMSTNIGGCIDTISKQIVVGPIPTIGFTHTPVPNCRPPVTFNYSAFGASSYQWAWQTTGGSSSSATPSHTYNSAPLIDSIILVGTSGTGCMDTLKVADTVYDMTVGYHGPIHGCAPFTFTSEAILHSQFGPNGYYPAPVVSVTWDFGDGTSSASAIPTHTYNNPGTYPRVATITTSNGCVIHDTVLIHVGGHVIPSFTVPPGGICPKVLVTFTNTTVLNPGAVVGFTWDVGQAYTLINNRDAITAFVRPGTYDIKLYADSNGCVDSSVCVACMVINPSNANFTDSNYCSPNSTTVAFTDSSIGATMHYWTFGDGNSSPAVSPVHTYASAGNYTVTLITSNSTYGCRDTMTQLVRVSVPQTSLTALDTSLCLGDTLRLIPNFSGGHPYKYIWFIDNLNTQVDSLLTGVYFVMSPPTLTNPFGINNPIGYHSVKLVVNSINTGAGNCLDSFSRNNYVIVSKPDPGFTASPIVGCSPLQVTFSDTSHFTPGTQSGSRYWWFGDGDTALNNSVTSTHIYQTQGFYSVKLKVTDWNGCSDSVTKSNYIEARKPSATFQVSSQNACAGSPLNFSNLSAGATALISNWYFGDGDTSKLTFGVSHIYKTVGVYNCRLVVFDSTGCTDTMNLPITVTRPIAAFTLSDTIAVCPPLIVNFTSSSTNASSYSWNFGNSGTAAIVNPVSTFSAPGVYNVRLIVTDPNGCPDTAFAKVRVLGYAGAFTYGPVNGCHPLVVNFSNNISNVPSFLWDFADGTIIPGSGSTASHTYLSPGAYVPKVIFSDNISGCKASSVGIDTIKVDGIVAGFKALPPCEKTNLQLVDTSHSFFSALKDSHWDFGGMGIATGNPVNHMYANAGTYAVTLISTNAQGCKDTLTSNLTIFPLPKVRTMDDTSLCVPDALPLGVSGAQSYNWSPALSLSCTACTTPMASPTVPTSYVVTGTDSNGCMNKDTVRIGIQTKTTFVTSGNTEICLGDRVKLLVAGATIYSWTPPESLDSPNIAAPYASPKVTTTYVITGKEGSCAVDTHMVTVVVHPIPTVDAGGNLKAIAGRGVQLQASGSGITHVVWDNDSTLSCTTCFGPIAKPRQTTTYHIKAYNDYGCSSLDSVTVTVLCDGSQLFIPNTFSPNGDGNNDHFFARGNGISNLKSMRIYSRWGELLYERINVQVNDESAGWDGTHNGRILNPDVFVYVIEATCDSGEPILFKGDVTLIK